MITAESLKQILPQLPEDTRNACLPHLQSATAEFEVNTPRREAAFLAQLAHESAGLTRFVENLNYGAKGLMGTWPKRFPTLAQAQQYERQPEKIANYVYARAELGNGNEASGDGWRYRGRGPIQITGRANYKKYGDALNFDLIGNPDAAATPEVGFRVAGLYWKENGLNELADKDMFETITKRINGGLTGLEERRKYYERAKTALGVPAARGELPPESERGVALRPVYSRGGEALEEDAPLVTKRKAVVRSTKRKTKKVSTKKTRTGTVKRRTAKVTTKKVGTRGTKRPVKKPVAKKVTKKTSRTKTQRSTKPRSKPKATKRRT